MIKSSKVTLKFANKGKQEKIHHFLDLYKDAMNAAMADLWELSIVPSKLNKTATDKLVLLGLSARAAQAAGKQASGVVRGIRRKQAKAQYRIKRLSEENKRKLARKAERLYAATLSNRPVIENIKAELDERFVKIELSDVNSFDGWLTIGSIGLGRGLPIPFKLTKHFNKMLTYGTLKNCIRLSYDSVTFMFDIPDTPCRIEGTVVGIDVGKSTCISCSTGITSTPNKHGHDLNSILAKMSSKKKGSRAFERCAKHRTNYVNWSINQLDLVGVKQLNVERIYDMRRNKRTSRMLSHWKYTEIFGKLGSYCAERGVLVVTVNPAHTSQRCSQCGWTRKCNRKGKRFSCDRCGYAADADLNASRNITLPLTVFTPKQRLRLNNRTGFYWFVEGQAPIVPAVIKHDTIIY